jgi:hypothetical protein
MSDDQGGEDIGYELVMPFQPVISNGGPYDDDAYVAGYEMGRLDAMLAAAKFPDEGQPIHGDNREQADLIAMRHGYMGEFTNDNGDGWVYMKIHTGESKQ